MAETWPALAAYFETVRRVLAPLVGLQPAQRHDGYKMGGQCETFCRQTLALLAANPQMVPPSPELPRRRQTWWRWTRCVRG